MMKRHKHVEPEHRDTQASEPPRSWLFWRMLLPSALSALLAGLVASLLAIVLMGILRIFSACQRQ